MQNNNRENHEIRPQEWIDMIEETLISLRASKQQSNAESLWQKRRNRYQHMALTIITLYLHGRLTSSKTPWKFNAEKRSWEQQGKRITLQQAGLLLWQDEIKRNIDLWSLGWESKEDPFLKLHHQCARHTLELCQLIEEQTEKDEKTKQR